MTLWVEATDRMVAEDSKLETTAEAEAVGRADTTELTMLVDSMVVEDSWATPETVTVTTVGTWMTVLLRTVDWRVVWAATTLENVLVTSYELVDVLSMPPLRVTVTMEMTGEVDTMTAVEEDATAETASAVDVASGTRVVKVWTTSYELVDVLSTPLTVTVTTETTGEAVVMTEVFVVAAVSALEAPGM